MRAAWDSQLAAVQCFALASTAEPPLSSPSGSSQMHELRSSMRSILGLGDVDDLIRCVAPRRLFVVSSEDDPVAADASDLVARAEPAFTQANCPDHLAHLRVAGGHALDARRFHAIVDWVAQR
jgi:hypothetical protein